MVALNFPTSPTDGQTYNGYVWDASITAWSRESEDGIQPVETSATAPSSPADGQLWFDTASETLFVYYEAGGEWVGTGGGNVASDAIQPNSNQITEDYTFESNENGVSAGPITIADGVTVTIGATSAWSIV